MNQEGTQDELLKQALDMIRPWVKEERNPQPNRLDVVIGREDLLAVVEALKNARWGYLSAITGMDRPATSTPESAEQQEGAIEVLYHFCERNNVLTLRVSVPYGDASLPSICNILPSATLFERELSEMFGVNIMGTPDPSRLLLPDNWPNGVYPLRKSFTGFSEVTEAQK
ncbi:MAG: NADH-quinone oxidoreductase subunit C [Thermanaerothrix sp.]|uniref:NADH-quinone oxidoreductase subunit C n=1 Tax=Thermanaerothrix sp. TaxID=2972675 RepID=UPI003C7DC4B0